MISVRNLYKRFGKVEVLTGLNLDVVDGETLVILGRSGCGKSVLLKHIMGILKADAGEVFIDGVDVMTLSERDLMQTVMHIGMLFQSAALFDSLTVEENVAFHLTQHKNRSTGKPWSKSEMDDRVELALKLVGLQGTQKKMPSELSGGMRKRAALARLIAYRPRCLLYDEPTTGLDPITAMQINELIIATQQELGATSIVVTHDIPSALTVGDRLALHNNGVIELIAPKNNFFSLDNEQVRAFHKNAKLPL